MESVLFNIYKGLEYEQVEYPRQGQIIVDAGAGVGMFTVKASLQVGDTGFVHAFEPEPENFQLLMDNTKKLDNVAVYQKALWSSHGVKKFYVRSDNPLGHGLWNIGVIKEVIEVETVTLDSIVEGRVDFLKMDIEEAELEALRGATRILKESKPFISMEIHSEPLFHQVQEFLNPFGYSLVTPQPRHSYVVHYWR